MPMAVAARSRAFASINCQSASSYRTFTTARRALPTQARATQPFLAHNATVRQAFRRSYADHTPAPVAPPIQLQPPGKQKKRAGWIRWTWRFTKLAAAVGTGYVVWTVYDGRHPADQMEPDPSKKTLVVLGMSSNPSSQYRCVSQLTLGRHWMGFCRFVEEARDRKLQCHW